MPIPKSTRTKTSVRLPAFAKVNLCLHVMGKRPDNYHELRTIFQAISLHDTLEIAVYPTPSLRKRRELVEGADQPVDSLFRSNDRAMLTPDNLVLRAINAIREEVGFRGSVSADLEKRIPVARGLGG
ncbi:MAG: hypothetical protein WAN97_10355, partial [Candidatus Acidiferrales bacterium]